MQHWGPVNGTIAGKRRDWYPGSQHGLYCLLFSIVLQVFLYTAALPQLQFAFSTIVLWLTPMTILLLSTLPNLSQNPPLIDVFKLA